LRGNGKIAGQNSQANDDEAFSTYKPDLILCEHDLKIGPAKTVNPLSKSFEIYILKFFEKHNTQKTETNL